MPHFIAGVVHPRGESDDYDGIFLRDREFDHFAKNLTGKPLLFNHDEDCRIGHVVSAWSAPGKGGEKELFALAEIDTTSLNGTLAKGSISAGIINDFSLGHELNVEHSAFSRTVVDKTPTEISICEQGARENTHIYASTSYPPKYINTTSTGTNQYNKMSVEESTTPPTVETPVPADPVPLTQGVFEKLKALQELADAQEAELQVFKESGKKKREGVLNDGVKEFIKHIIDTNPSLAQHATEIEDFQKRMIESDSAGPIVELLQCAASKSSTSVVELEKAYQAQKAKDAEIKKLQDELLSFKAQAFSTPADRVVKRVAVSAVASASPTKKRNVAGLNDDLFASISAGLRTPVNNIPMFKPPNAIRNKFI